MRRPVGLGREYAKLFAARTFSNLGDGMTLVAGPLLAATLTRDPLQIAGLPFAQRLPWLLFALPGGALVDRLDRRRLMAAVDAFRSGDRGGPRPDERLAAYLSLRSRRRNAEHG